jgi:hypothetical protein
VGSLKLPTTSAEDISRQIVAPLSLRFLILLRQQLEGVALRVLAYQGVFSLLLCSFCHKNIHLVLRTLHRLRQITRRVALLYHELIHQDLFVVKTIVEPVLRRDAVVGLGLAR